MARRPIKLYRIGSSLVPTSVLKPPISVFYCNQNHNAFLSCSFNFAIVPVDILIVTDPVGICIAVDMCQALLHRCLEDLR